LPREAWLDLDAHLLSGVERVDAHTWRIRIHGKYPQFAYWLAMPFFAPVPREVDRFFAQPGMQEKNLTLDWWPVGTGPYMLTENDPNRRMVLSRNPNFRGETYPCDGEPGDAEAGLLDDCGKPLPFIEQAVFTREKEAIPYWNKFLQGYYDASGISSDSFDQAVRVNVGGDVALSDEMRKKGIALLTSVRSSTFYMGFNMQDAVVGGLDEKVAKLPEADDTLGHHAENRRMQSGVRQTLDLVNVIVGSEFTRPEQRKVRDTLTAVGNTLAQIGWLAVGIQRERRMRLVADAGSQGQLIDTFGNRLDRRIIRQGATIGGKVARMRQLLNRGRNQFVRATQVVVLQRRLVDLRGKGDLVLGIGLRRIQVFGPIGEGGVKNLATGIAGAVGRVTNLATGGKANTQQKADGQFSHEREFNKGLTRLAPSEQNALKPITGRHHARYQAPRLYPPRHQRYVVQAV
jgi:hypothetical protein